MIGFNHALVGGLIGKFLPLPIALPLALASHFVLDALPHYGIEQRARDVSRTWKVIFIADFFATLSLAVIAIKYHHYHMLWCGAIAVVPDLVWVVRVIMSHSFNMSDNQHWFTKWHAAIQLYERPWGLRVELPLAAILFYFVVLQTVLA